MDIDENQENIPNLANYVIHNNNIPQSISSNKKTNNNYSIPINNFISVNGPANGQIISAKTGAK
jgi:hypothetical protein